jgi:hypothetical protein
MPVIPSTIPALRERQEDREFEASLSYTVRYCLKKKRKQNKTDNLLEV